MRMHLGKSAIFFGSFLAPVPLFLREPRKRNEHSSRTDNKGQIMRPSIYLEIASCLAKTNTSTDASYVSMTKKKKTSAKNTPLEKLPLHLLSVFFRKKNKIEVRHRLCLCRGGSKSPIYEYSNAMFHSSANVSRMHRHGVCNAWQTAGVARFQKRATPVLKIWYKLVAHPTSRRC